jgi:acetyl esterase/lipase
MKRNWIFSIAFISFTSILFGQEIKLEEIMKGEGFTGYSPRNPQWTIDGKYVVFDWNPENKPDFVPYRYELSTGKITPVSKQELLSMTPCGDYSAVYNGIFYGIEGGNLISYNLKTKKKVVLFAAANGIHSLQVASQSGLVSFMINDDLYVYDTFVGGIKQVTKVSKLNGTVKPTLSPMQQQQRELFPYFVEQDTKRAFQKDQRAKYYTPCIIQKEENESIFSITLSASGDYAIVVLQKQAETPPTVYGNYVTENGVTKSENARPKVGNEEPSCRLGILDMINDSLYFVSFDGLPDIRRIPEYFKEYGRTDTSFEQNRPLAIPAVMPHERNGKALLDLRSYDNKDRWIVQLDLLTGKFILIDHQHDEAWIAGPGITEWDDSPGVLGWLDDKTCYFQSEESGYSHLYTYSFETKQRTALTHGNWEVQELQLSRDRKSFYLIANKVHPGVKNGYRLEIASGELTSLFVGDFGIEWILSPDEKTWALRCSTPLEPWELYVAPNTEFSKKNRITFSQSKEYKTLKLVAPEVVEIPTRDGKVAYGRLYRPTNANGKAVFFVHGAGYLQNAHHYWSSYHREMLFHQKLVAEGYTVLDLDYRASEGYGRDWRTGIYRNMGGKDLEDYLDAKEWIVKKYGIDSYKIGIYGGSYGGFITLMGLLKTPDAFACGAALRSVTDWAHYNHEYTSNILNYPGTDTLAYRRSSPIYYAEGLNKPLLMLHGVVDDNVQFQDIVRLNQRFIELGKKTFNLSIYPTEAHGFQYTPAWVDEYRRIYELFKTHL